ncbi:hypothetical protein [Spiroplasma endosymbiont of Amphibalanus improvisus]|uniref:hypothetical protein n=1 Tax=Spiroplasma endosymbiont of Amphibalanus improvisus TaxID=3066327 RepID=UPI00313DC693
MKKIADFIIRPFIRTTLLLSGITSIVFGVLMIFDVLTPYQLMFVSADNWQITTILISIIAGFALIILPFFGFTKFLVIPLSVIIIIFSLYFILSVLLVTSAQLIYIIPYCISLCSAGLWLFF